MGTTRHRSRSRSRATGAVGLLAGLLIMGLLAACGSGADEVTPVAAGATAMPEPGTSDQGSLTDGEDAAEPRAKAKERPNIVLVLMDDASMDLVRTLRSAKKMKRRGASYRHAFVVNSLCCVSRASLLTGQYPHQTGVLTNTANTPNRIGPIGGHEAYAAYGNERRSFNVRLQRSGYRTGYIGKFLNQYEYNPGRAIPKAPPGWSDWRVLFGSAYDGWDFHSSYLEGRQVRVRHHPAPPAGAGIAAKDEAYAGTVIHRMAMDFIRKNQKRSNPYFLQVAPFAPHSRVNPTGHYPGDPAFPPAFRDRPRPGQPFGNCGPIRCDRLGVKHLPGYGDDLEDNRPRKADGTVLGSWRPKRTALTRAGAVASLRNRARMVQSVDRMMHDILAAVDDNTIVMLTSDNGFHLGQHGLGSGKSAPYDSDVRVPLLVVGPGVKQGARNEIVSNIDLAATFEDLAGLSSPKYRAGHSFAPTFGRPGRTRHNYTFFEHTWAPSLGNDPDKAYAGGTMDLIPSYVAVRSRTGLLVRLDLDNSWRGTRYAWEFYDYTESPWEKTNTYAEPRHQAQVKELRAKLRQFDRCRQFTRNMKLSKRCRNLTR